MKKTRFNGLEASLYEKIFKLASQENSSILEIMTLKIYMDYGPEQADSFLTKVDQLGLYDQRIYMLYRACQKMDKTFYVIFLLFERYSNGKITQEEIIEMREQQHFNRLVSTLTNELNTL